MTTRTYTSVIDHTTDAGYLAWRDQLFSELILCGLVQTADTGQYTAGAGARPATNTAGDYLIARLPNSSLYFKFETGTGSSAANPQVWITVGTGSSGAGVITGQTSTRSTWGPSGAPTSTVTPYTTYICVVADAISIILKANGFSGGNGHGGALCVGRTADNTGATTSHGFGVLRNTGLNQCTFQSVRTDATASTYTDSGSFSLVPGQVNNSALQNGDLQTYIVWLNVPDVQPFMWATVYVIAEVPALNTINATLFGSTAHNYIAAGRLNGTSSTVANSSTAYALAFIYE